jgi:hypothetical protein
VLGRLAVDVGALECAAGIGQSRVPGMKGRVSPDYQDEKRQFH